MTWMSLFVSHLQISVVVVLIMTYVFVIFPGRYFVQVHRARATVTYNKDDFLTVNAHCDGLHG